MTNDNIQQTEPECPASFTKDEIETFFHATHVLTVAIEALSERIPPKYRDTDRDVLMVRAVRELMMDTVMENTTEEEFAELLVDYGCDDDEPEAPEENHAGTRTVQ